ncbi:MAG: hypothetical protein RL660_1846 [Bacteroidota bacterium]|jgi:type IX secretion system PorP/SprF family membrane protein
MKKLFIISLAIVASANAFAQQEPHYTQNQFNSNLLLNPAYAGSDPYNTSIGARYRNQWVNFNGAPTTYSLIGDTKWNRLGFGLAINQDKIGIERITTPDLNIAYHLPFKKDRYLSIGFKGGANFLKADFTNLVNVDMTDPLYNAPNNKATIPFLGFGALYYSPKFYAGISSPRIVSFESPVSPRTRISRAHYYAYGGGRIQLENGLEFRPAVLVKYQAQAPIELDLAVDAWYKNMLGFGVGYRTGDAVNLMVKSNINKRVYVGYSYDMNISVLRPFNAGSHEVFLGIKFPKKQEADDEDRSNSLRYF